MSLRTYRRKRDFRRTSEPRGSRVAGAGRTFVIQKHAARRLHHDFRLEFDGVLLSWAVPKGPPSEPGSKVLAVRTEDHPLEYGAFEGVIPKGEYGGGTVMVWDRGTWRPEGSARAGLKKGKLDFHLEGERVGGRWSLVRMSPKPGDSADNWLLIKRSDRGARGRTTHAVLDRSVATGRTMAEIAGARDRQRSTDAAERRETKPGRANRKAAKRHGSRSTVDPATVPGAKVLPQPSSLQPQLATLVAKAPAGDGWLHEVKFDGYRLLAFLAAGRVRLITRTGQDWTARFPTIATALTKLPVDDAVLDGEVVALRADGRSDFQALQNSLDGGSNRALAFFAFDLPHCDGHDLSDSPLQARKELLEGVLATANRDGPLRFSDHVVGRGPAFFEQACARSLEGVVSKRVSARYQGHRTRTWVKTKCLQRQEFVVGGYTKPAGSRQHFGALLLGVHVDGRLRYAGKVGTGFTASSLAELGTLLRSLGIETSPFADPPPGHRVHWVRPECVVEVAFTEWTGDGLLRHPSFQGIREDKAAAEVRRERPRTKVEATNPGDPDEVAGVSLTHQDRVLYEEQGITKLDLARYYETVADRILPHVQGRPLTLVRCPQGLAATCFYQKHLTEGLGDPVRAVPVPEGDATRDYIGVDDVAGLVTLVQFGALELHPWGSRSDRLDRPDRIVIDLDPGPGVAWTAVVEAALALREILDALGLTSFARTTGGKGLHVVLPIERRTDWAVVKAFAHEIVATLARTAPDRYVLTASKAQRKGRIFLDYLRNDRGATAVASWSSRARPAAPVAMPLRWDEVSAELEPQAFTVQSVPTMERADPWAGFFDVRQVVSTRVLRALGTAGG